MEYLTKHIRQISVPEIGLDGHKKLLNSRVLIVGAGGLGIPISVYMACSGVGTIGIIDYDIIEESNLGRQFLYSSKDIGGYCQMLWIA
jgi:adenylyltransferase/sulfurtransferase